MVSPAVTPATRQLLEQGQSVWLDSISRQLIDSGELQRMVGDGWIRGVTSNPSIFEKAIAGSNDYDAALRRAAVDGVATPYEAFVTLASRDIRDACDVLRPIYDESLGRDGYVSLEVPPGIEADTAATLAEARRLFALIGRPNLMIKVPGTPEGISAVADLIAAGININITLLFAVSAYEATAEAYIAGLERRLIAGEALDRVASVASFFVSRLDTAIDRLLPEDSPLRGKAAVANARVAYARFQALFSGPRWEKLAAAGAQVQRPLWASTGTKNPAYSDVLYVEELVAADTVNTMPEATLRAVLDHGQIRPTLLEGLDQSRRDLSALAEAGVDLDQVTAQLLIEGLGSFERDFQRLLDRLELALEEARGGAAVTASLGGLAGAVDARLAALDQERVIERIWTQDHTVWKDDPTELANRLGWLTVGDEMSAKVDDLRAFAAEVAGEGFTTAVLLGMGGSSLGPEVLQATFGTAPGALALKVIDTTNPAQIAATQRELDLSRTLFIVASKSGGTIETMSHLAYFWEKAPEGRQFVAITDPGSSLEALARERGFRRVFANPPEIGGRYSVLSYFGLVPAALIGVDIEQLLAAAREMATACRAGVAARNPGALLGAIMGVAALAGRDKLTLVMPEPFATLGYWIEQLVAESTGKEGRGILPVEGERLATPDEYGDDRLFVAIGDYPALAAIEAAGHPVVRIPYQDVYQLGAEFFRWEFATAVAGKVLEINPFDQPNVQEAKDVTGRVLAGEAVDTQGEPLRDLLRSVQDGDYIAITAYLPRNATTIAALDEAREALRTLHGTAVTVGFGPRFLHSTGQLHKGGANNGVFIQVVEDSEGDLLIPGKAFSFGLLQRAQADGDLAALKAHGRRASRVTLGELQAELAK